MVLVGGGTIFQYLKRQHENKLIGKSGMVKRVANKQPIKSSSKSEQCLPLPGVVCEEKRGKFQFFRTNIINFQDTEKIFK